MTSDIHHVGNILYISKMTLIRKTPREISYQR